MWAPFRIPIGLAFFMHSSVTNCVVALYPSPAGATESELHFETWRGWRVLNPVLDELEPDAEALIVNRLSDPPSTRSLRSTAATCWSGSSNRAGRASRAAPGWSEAVAGYFDELRSAAAPA